MKIIFDGSDLSVGFGELLRNAEIEISEAAGPGRYMKMANCLYEILRSFGAIPKGVVANIDDVIIKAEELTKTLIAIRGNKL